MKHHLDNAALVLFSFNAYWYYYDMSHEAWVGQEKWEQSLPGLRNSVRQELVTRQLREHLRPPREEVSVLDIGCGQGTQLLRLARSGYRITGLDLTEASMALLRKELRGEDPEVKNRVELVVGSMDDLGKSLQGKFDVVLCHGVIMYLPTLQQSLEQLAQIVAPGGILSTLTRNRFSIAMRAGMKGNYIEALEAFNATHYTGGIEIENVRGDEPQEVIDGLGSLGFSMLAWYGVRLFTDHKPFDSIIPSDFEELVRVEEEAGRRDPYRQLCSLTHVISQKN